ncbi:hypothetical protein WQ54_19770 [Bacillus sp. SA1-12]|nr:hypothetical protein WQ54_19770 [Bacillus sp. SA1-12]
MKLIGVWKVLTYVNTNERPKLSKRGVFVFGSVLVKRRNYNGANRSCEENLTLCRVIKQNIEPDLIKRINGFIVIRKLRQK